LKKASKIRLNNVYALLSYYLFKARTDVSKRRLTSNRRFESSLNIDSQLEHDSSSKRPGAYIGYHFRRRRRALIARQRSVYGAIGIEITRRGIADIRSPVFAVAFDDPLFTL